MKIKNGTKSYQKGFASFLVILFGSLLGLMAVFGMAGKSVLSSGEKRDATVIAPGPGQLSEQAANSISGIGVLGVLGHPRMNTLLEFIDKEDLTSIQSLIVHASEKRSISLPSGSYNVNVGFIDPVSNARIRSMVIALTLRPGSESSFIDLNTDHVSHIPFPNRDLLSK